MQKTERRNLLLLCTSSWDMSSLCCPCTNPYCSKRNRLVKQHRSEDILFNYSYFCSVSPSEHTHITLKYSKTLSFPTPVRFHYPLRSHLTGPILVLLSRDLSQIWTFSIYAVSKVYGYNGSVRLSQLLLKKMPITVAKSLIINPSVCTCIHREGLNCE